LCNILYAASVTQFLQVSVVPVGDFKVRGLNSIINKKNYIKKQKYTFQLLELNNVNKLLQFGINAMIYIYKK
jgi:hypothetical protein